MGARPARAWWRASVAACVWAGLAPAIASASDAPCPTWVVADGHGGYEILASGDTNGEIDWANTLWALQNAAPGATVTFSSASDESEQGGTYYFNRAIWIVAPDDTTDVTLRGAGEDLTFLEAVRRADPSQPTPQCVQDFVASENLDFTDTGGGFEHWPDLPFPALLRFDGVKAVTVENLTFQVLDHDPVDPYVDLAYADVVITGMNTLLAIWGTLPGPPPYPLGTVTLSNVRVRGSAGDVQGKNVVHTTVIGRFGEGETGDEADEDAADVHTSLVTVDECTFQNGGVVGAAFAHDAGATVRVTHSLFAANQDGVELGNFGPEPAPFMFSYSAFAGNDTNVNTFGSAAAYLSVTCSTPESVDTAPCSDEGKSSRAR